MQNEMPETIYLKDYTPSAYLISHTDLTFDLQETATETTAILTIYPNENTKAGVPLTLNGEALTLKSIALNGIALKENEYQYEGDILTVINPPYQTFELKTIAVSDPKANTSLNGLYLTHGVYCTQCEAEGFRKITFSLDRPDVLSTYKVRLEGPLETTPILLSNGNLLETGALKGDSTRHFAVWEDPHPKPSYLFALVGGDLDSLSDNYITSDGRDVALNIYVEKGNANKAKYAMGALKRSFKWDEEQFGCVYDLDIFNIVAVPHFNMGAMENKGLNIFNDKYILADLETATDTDFELIEAIIGHEYFHNWTGNRVTCRDWFQLCLKEGLTVFRDAEFTSMLRSRPVKRIDDVKMLRNQQFPEDAGPMAHACLPDSYMEINNFYTATVYRKGAEVVRALHSIVGAKNFRTSMDHYLATNDGKAATVNDFLASFEHVTGRDLSQFAIWYTQAGTPTLNYSTSYEPSTKQYTLNIEQSCNPTPGQENKLNYHMPIKLGLLDASGADMALLVEGKPLAENMVELTQTKQTFIFDDIDQQPTISFLRDFSAPVKVQTELSQEALLFLMANDSDGFNRWQAAQSLAMQAILSLLKAEVSDDVILDGNFAKALQKSINNENLEPALRAQILNIPTINDIAGIIGKDIDHSAINTARKKLISHIAEVLAVDLTALYVQLNQDQSFNPDAKGSGVRAFRSAILKLMMQNKTEANKAISIAHYENSNNMVDRLAGLEAIRIVAPLTIKTYLTDFYNKYQNNHLLLDKWLSFQAIDTSENALENVKTLTQHQNFSFTTPNNVYALISGFSSGNPVAFNAKDGSGYEFIADMIIKLDAINPQVAARMVSPLRGWKKLEQVRRSRAKLALQRVMNVNNLSTNTYEIVSKSLSL